MLVLSRKLNESIVIDGNIRITVLDIRGSQVRLGVEAPTSIGIARQELLTRAEANASHDVRIPATQASLPHLTN